MRTLATWLLRTFGSGSTIETLIGDLTEEYQDGRSGLWLLGQALIAIAVTFFYEVRSRWVFVLRAVMLTGLLVFLLRSADAFLIPWVIVALDVYVPEGEPYLSTASRFVNGVWVQQPTLVPVDSHSAYYVPFAKLVFASFGAWLIGATVGRLHRERLQVSILAVALTYAAYYLSMVVWALMRQVSPPPEGVVFVEGLWREWWLLTDLGSAAAFMIGGLMSSRGRRHRPIPV